MPIYGYHCPSCDTEFEVSQRMTDASGADCPQCGTASRRVFFPTGIVFKGSGFYKTDSRRAATASVNGSGPSGGDRASGDDNGASAGKTGGKAGGSESAATTGEKASSAASAASAKKDGGASPASVKKDSAGSTSGSAAGA